MVHGRADLLIKLGDKSVPLAAIECDRESRARYLGPYHGAGDKVACLCRTDGIPMGVARRTTPYETFYLYPLHRTDPTRHAFGCPHRISPDNSSRPETLPVIEIGDGFVNVNLKLPLFRAGPNDPRAEQRGEDGADDGERKRPRGELISLLEVLWTQAELNLWHRGFAGRRSYYVVRQRLMRSATGLRVRGRNLATRFYVPPVYRADQDKSIEKELNRFLDSLIGSAGKSWYGFVGGLLKKIETMNNGSVTLRLAHTWLGLRADANMWRRLGKKWFAGSPSTTDDEAYVILAHVLREDGLKPRLVIEDLAVMEIADTNCWIPVHSDHERRLAQHLVQNGRRFRKPLDVEFEEGALRPDFILEDREDRTHLEVLRRSVTPTAKRWEEKMTAYTALEQALWVWDPDKKGDIPKLPPQEYRKTR